MKFHDPVGQAGRRNLWMSTVRDKIDKCFNPDGSGAETQFNPTWGEPIWIIGADDSGTLRDLNLTTFKLTGEEIAYSCLALLEKRIAQSGPWGAGNSPPQTPFTQASYDRKV